MTYSADSNIAPHHVTLHSVYGDSTRVVELRWCGRWDCNFYHAVEQTTTRGIYPAGIVFVESHHVLAIEARPAEWFVATPAAVRGFGPVFAFDTDVPPALRYTLDRLQRDFREHRDFEFIFTNRFGGTLP